MKRTVAEERRPEPLEVYADTESVKNEVLDTAEKLSSEGYGDDFMYQIRSVAPPIDEAEDILHQLEGNFVYITVRGMGDEGVRDEQFSTGHRFQNTEVFEQVTAEIDEVVDELGYDLEYWHIGSVATSTRSGSQLIDDLEGMQVQATAKVDAGLESQRGKMGFQPISIGWFYRAPMNKEMQFGYRAFPNREFNHDKNKDYEDDDELVEDLLGRVAGLREDEVNMHALSNDEVEVLTDIEEEMQRRNLL